MANKVYSNIGNRITSTPQSQPIPGKEDRMSKNNAGGYAFNIDDWKMLERFLVLGTEGGTYYVGEREHTFRNYETLKRCLCNDPLKAMSLIYDISTEGRAPKNSPALFALAVAMSIDTGDESKNRVMRREAMRILPNVARIGTHLFEFVGYVNGMRSWGRSLRTGVANWYLSKNPDQISFQMAKYQSRNEWAHRDVLRMCHPKVSVSNPEVDNLFRWAIGDEKRKFEPELLIGLVACLEEMKKAKNSDDVIKLIDQYKAPFEVVPTEYRKDAAVWTHMLPYMGAEAMVRNLGNMTSYGVFDEPANRKLVCDRLHDEAWLKKNRIHPLKLYVGLRQYSAGKGAKGNNSWNVMRDIANALEDAIYLAFKQVEPTGKRIYYALDVSGSMTGGVIAGIDNFKPVEGTAIMSLVLANSERNYTVRGFTTKMLDLDIRAGMRIEDAVKRVHRSDFGRTDCAMPMIDAASRGEDYDAFVIMTDNETWAGNSHPHEELEKYRRKVGHPVKMIVMGMTSTNFSIADPKDTDTLDVCGFDTSVPEFISKFIAG